MFKVNEYFDGKVASIAFQTETLPATVGVIGPGEYSFGTSQKETMTVVSGHLEAKLPGQADWRGYGQGESFEIAAGERFEVRTQTDVAYLCLYE